MARGCIKMCKLLFILIIVTTSEASWFGSSEESDHPTLSQEGVVNTAITTNNIDTAIKKHVDSIKVCATLLQVLVVCAVINLAIQVSFLVVKLLRRHVRREAYKLRDLEKK